MAPPYAMARVTAKGMAPERLGTGSEQVFSPTKIRTGFGKLCPGGFGLLKIRLWTAIAIFCSITLIDIVLGAWAVAMAWGLPDVGSTFFVVTGLAAGLAQPVAFFWLLASALL